MLAAAIEGWIAPKASNPNKQLLLGDAAPCSSDRDRREATIGGHQCPNSRLNNVSPRQYHTSALKHQSDHHARYRAGIMKFAQAVITSVVAISTSAIADAKGQLLLVLNSQYSSGAIIWKRGPPSRYGVA